MMHKFNEISYVADYASRNGHGHIVRPRNIVPHDPPPVDYGSDIETEHEWDGYEVTELLAVCAPLVEPPETEIVIWDGSNELSIGWIIYYVLSLIICQHVSPHGAEEAVQDEPNKQVKPDCFINRSSPSVDLIEKKHLYLCHTLRWKVTHILRIFQKLVIFPLAICGTYTTVMVLTLSGEWD